MADAKAAYEDGTLQRRLLVLQDRSDGGTFDESLSELPLDGLEVKKGAARL